MNKYPMIIKVESVNGKLVAVDASGNEVTDLVSYSTRKKAVNNGTALFKADENSKLKQVPLEEFDRASNVPVADEPVCQWNIFKLTKQTIANEWLPRAVVSV